MIEFDDTYPVLRTPEELEQLRKPRPSVVAKASSALPPLPSIPAPPPLPTIDNWGAAK